VELATRGERKPGQHSRDIHRRRPPQPEIRIRLLPQAKTSGKFLLPQVQVGNAREVLTEGDCIRESVLPVEKGDCNPFYGPDVMHPELGHLRLSIEYHHVPSEATSALDEANVRVGLGR
jgi:hypothetical protein